MLQDKSIKNERFKGFLGVSALLLAYSLTGCLMLFNVTRGSTNNVFFVQKQLVSMALCLIAAFMIFMLSTERLKLFFVYGGIIVYLLLWGLFVFGQRINGAIGWYRFGAYSFQPSEIFKPAFIVGLAWVCGKTSAFNSPGKRLLWQLLFVLAVVLPIALQPDWGTVLVYSVTFAVVIWCEGLPRRYLAIIAVLGISAATVAILNFRHVRLRFTSFLEALFSPLGPTEYHAQRLQECLVKGGWTGSMFQTQDALNALPYRYSDSLFAGATELLGAAGVIPIVLLCLAWCFHCSCLASKHESTFGRCIFLGAGVMLTTQAFIHLGVNLGLMPNTGIPLPLFSYGGSSLLATFVIFSMVQRLQMEKGI